MKHIVQPEFGLCLASCVAMVTDETLDTVLNETTLSKRHGIWYLPLREAIKFLAERDRGFGIAARPHTRILDPRDTLEMTLDLRLAPAIITVKSDRPDWYHCAVWDNESLFVRDPAIYRPVAIQHYEIEELSFVTPITEPDRRDKESFEHRVIEEANATH